MKISKKGDYALRALIYLALNEGRGVVQMHEIAEREIIPQKFLEQILLMLKRAGYLSSKSGVGGGYSLRKPSDKIILGSVIRLIDGPLASIGCVSRTAHINCHKEKNCGLRSVLLDVRNITAEILDNITIADICNRIKGAGKRKERHVIYYV